MRIITGRYRGRTLKTVPDLSVRPATGMVRQTLFNMLVNRLDFEGLEVLDAFAGSGSLGFEASSRGARRVTFIEWDPAAAAILEENARVLGCVDTVEVIQADAMTFLRTTGERYGLIFADPPYAFPATASIPEVVFSRGLLHPGGYLLIEHAATLQFAATGLYTPGPVKKFGRTVVSFFQNPHEAGR